MQRKAHHPKTLPPAIRLMIEEEDSYESDLPEEEEEKEGGALQDLNPIGRVLFFVLMAAMFGGFVFMVVRVAAQIGE